jgi:glycosyltransferase involved in cell wall biosynthesis
MNKRVVLIGPVLPFRGGIAQHTSLLGRAVSEEAEVLMISFSRQYPKWLFPGESDRDPAYVSHVEKNTEYLIDSLNPLTWLMAVRRVKKFNADLVVIPWWTVFWAPCFGFIASLLTRNSIDVVYFCHNVIEHETSAWKTFLTRKVLNHGRRFMVHTKEDLHNLKTLIPMAEVDVHPHPIYDQFPEAKQELPRRKSLELLFYGFVRPYKGLDDLIDAMVLLKGKDIQLTIAGEFWNGEQETRKKIENIGLTDQIELRPRYHTDQETAELFARADVVVLPYRSATGSGVVPIAYHYNKAVLVTGVGGLPDVVNHKETGWIVPAEDITALSDTIAGIDIPGLSEMSKKIELFKKSLSWDSMARQLIKSQ